MTELSVAKTYRCLERKATIMGFELFDILIIGTTISLTNFFIGEVPFRLLITWTPALVLAGVLRYGKRGKPENFLVHWLRFKVGPNYYSAFKEAKNKWEKKN